MPNDVRATLRDLPPLTVIDLGGVVTTFAEEAVVDAYRQASAQGARYILLNFKEVDYINSAGIALIIDILTKARQRDQILLITGLASHYARIFEMMGLTQYAPLFESEAAARQSVAG